MKPTLECQCASLRRAAREVTRMYDAELRAAGFRSTQFTLLQALDRVGAIQQGELGEILGIDTTTLSRTLGALEDRGWVQSNPGEDRRVREWRLTRAGRGQYQKAVPHWKRAQERLRVKMGTADFSALIEAGAVAARAAGTD